MFTSGTKFSNFDVYQLNQLIFELSFSVISSGLNKQLCLQHSLRLWVGYGNRVLIYENKIMLDCRKHPQHIIWHSWWRNNVSNVPLAHAIPVRTLTRERWNILQIECNHCYERCICFAPIKWISWSFHEPSCLSVCLRSKRGGGGVRCFIPPIWFANS